jgi:hypothetical protein
MLEQFLCCQLLSIPFVATDNRNLRRKSQKLVLEQYLIFTLSMLGSRRRNWLGSGIIWDDLFQIRADLSNHSASRFQISLFSDPDPDLIRRYPIQLNLFYRIPNPGLEIKNG